MVDMSDVPDVDVAPLLDALPADKHGIAEVINRTPSTARDWIRSARQQGHAIEFDRATGKYHLEDEDPYQTAAELPHDDIQDAIVDGVHRDTLCEKYHTIPGEIETVIADLEANGFDVTRMGDAENPVYHSPSDLDNQFRFKGDDSITVALISDTHLGSSAEHLHELHEFYDRCVDFGITDVFHCGDISDGWKVHPGHLNEIKPEAAGWDRLKKYVVDNYPQRDGITTHFIEGNHDNKFYNRNNIHFGELIGNRRSDLHYLGNSQATIHLNRAHETTLELIHPSGGKPYTTGYRLQTLYRERNMVDRPTIAGVGHLHGSMYAETEGVKGLYAGAWKGTTTYGKRKGHQAKIGGWILEIELTNGAVSQFVPRWIGYEEKDKDNEIDIPDL
jgi:hypothetical protein